MSALYLTTFGGAIMRYLVKVDSKLYVAKADPKLVLTKDETQALQMSRAMANTVQGQAIRLNHRATVIEVV